jgi:hypothetical protein
MNISTIFFSQDHRMFNFLLIALNRNSDFLKSKQSRHSRQSTTYTFLWTELELCTHLLSKSQLFTSNRLTPTQSGWIIIHYCVDPRYWTSSPRWVKANFNQSYGSVCYWQFVGIGGFLAQHKIKLDCTTRKVKLTYNRILKNCFENPTAVSIFRHLIF